MVLPLVALEHRAVSYLVSPRPLTYSIRVSSTTVTCARLYRPSVPPLHQDCRRSKHRWYLLTAFFVLRPTSHLIPREHPSVYLQTVAVMQLVSRIPLQTL